MKLLITILLSVFSLAAFSQTYSMPYGNASTTMCSGTFYDSGGSGSNYTSNESNTLTICPTMAGNKVTMVFTLFDIENNYDFMYLYDGPTTSAPSLGVYSGTLTPTGTVQATSTNTSGCITIRFTSDGSYTYSGWAATVSCYNPCETITSNFVSSTPAPGAGSIIRVCQGSSVTFNGSGTFSSGSSAGAVYTWDFGNGQTGSGTTATATYTAAGVYFTNLNINKAGCINNNKLNQAVQVSTTPSFVGSTTSTTSLCTGQTATLIGSVTPTPYTATCTPPVSGLTHLPDGSGVSYNSCISVNCYNTGQTVASIADINNVCINMEHSYLGDLQIEIVCPNGQTVPLKTYAEGGSGTYLGNPNDDPSTLPGTGFNYCFAMSGATTLVNGPTVSSGNPVGSAIAAGTYSPSSSYAGLIGCPLNGNWCIKVTDNLSADDGYIFSWDVNFNAAVPPAQAFTPTITSETWSGPNIISTSGNNATIQPTVAGTPCYTLTAVDNFGCSYTTTKCLTVTASPNAGVSNTLSTCGSTVNVNLFPLLGAGTNTTGTWAAPATALTGGYLGTFNPSTNAAGNYTYTVPGSGGCPPATAIIGVGIPTTPTASNSGSLSCSTTTVSLSASIAGLNYTWTAPSGGSVSSVNTQTTAVSGTGGTYTVAIYNPATGCSYTVTTSVTQNTTPPIPTASNATTLTCSTTTAVLTGGGGGSYSWTGPSITAGGTTSTPTVSAPGNYTVLVTAANGCTATAVTTLTQNITPPSPTATNATTLTCSTTTAVLTGGGGGSYSWTGPSITAGGTTSTPTVSAPGSYTVKVTAANGCTATAVTTLTQNITPPSPTATNATTLTCSTTTAVLTGGGGGSYSWTGPSITAGGTTSTPTVSAPGNYTVLVTAANGCTATAVTTLTQNIVIPSVTMPGTQTITCASPTVSLIGSAGPSTCTALWNGGVCSGSTSFTASACSPNIYTLTVTNPANGCTNSGTVSVVPSVGIPIVNSSNTGSITCTNLTSQITATTAMTPVSYSWTGPGAIAGAATTSGTVSLGGTYQCVVTNTLTGCASTITTFVPTNTTAVAASIAPTASITCSTTSLTLNASPTGSYSYTWSPSPNLTGNSVSSPTVTLGGTYSVVITNTINGCVGNANVTVPSNTTIPVVTITVPSVTTTCANPTITISAASTPSTGVTYSWTAPGTGALNNVSLSNPIASGSGVFTVVVTNTASGCSSSLTQNTVQVTPDLAIPVTTLSSNAAPITCSNPTPSVSIATTASPVSYSWSPSSGIVAGTGTTATPSFSLAGSYSVIVTNTTSGCATSIASNVVTVTLDNTIPTITITPSQTLTCTTPTAEISTIVSPSSNLVYTWAGSGVSGSTTSSVVVNQAGVYSTTVINSINGCSVTAATSITSNTIVPTVTVSPNSFTTTCASPTVQLTASTSTSSVTYTWTSPGTGNLDNSSIGNPIASGSGIFTVSVTDASNGCSTALSQATVQVIADAGIPVINLSSSTETITCYNPTPSVAITTVASPVSYSWSPTSGIVAGTETTATPSFSLPNTYSVVVTNTVSGCATIVNLVTIYIDNTPPVITLSSGTNTGTITCTSPSVSISPSVTPSTNLTYSWSADPGISTPLNQAAATFTAAGIYTLAVTNTLTGCVSSTTATPNTFTVIANTNTPTVSVVPTSSNTVVGCGVNSSVTYTANAITANGSATYNWNPGAVTTSSFSASAAGVYTSVVIDAVSGCSTTTQFTVTGNSIVPNLSSSANASFPCGASSTSLSASSTNTNVSFSWTGPATAVITGSTTNTPTVDLAGNYVVTVTDLITGCINSNTISVTQTSITAAFTSDPSTGISPLTVNFTNQTTGATSYSWDFGNGSVSTSTNPTTVFTSGTYTVILTASTGSCSAPATGVIIVEDGLTLVIPNVFTPNGDGINDVFSITSTGVKEISLQIFNRWGQKLYEFSGPKASWDGIEPNGAKATDGTYFFFVKVTGFDDKVIEKNGTVNLFR